MKMFETTAAQGEITIRKIDALPEGLMPVEPENGKLVIGHSETGHHHRFDQGGIQVLEAPAAPEGMKILYAILDEPKELVHDRGHDTHETIHHEPGIYEFRIAREHDHYAALARQVAD